MSKFKVGDIVRLTKTLSNDELSAAYPHYYCNPEYSVRLKGGLFLIQKVLKTCLSCICVTSGESHGNYLKLKEKWVEKTNYPAFKITIVGGYEFLPAISRTGKVVKFTAGCNVMAASTIKKVVEQISAQIQKGML